VERYREPQRIPKGQNLTQRTMEHFHFWGAEDELRAARTIPRDYGIGGVTSYGSLLSGYSYDWLQRELVRPFYFTDNERLPQYATEAALRRRAAQIPAVTTMYDWTCEAVRPDEHGASVDIVSRDGARRRLRGDYVVGCDGSRSIVREQAGITQTRSDHDRLMVLLVFRSTGLHRLLERYPGKSFYNVLHPELDGYWKFFGRVDLGSTWFFHAPVPADTSRDNFDFRRFLHEAAGATSGAIGSHAYAARAGHHLTPQLLSSGRNIFEELGGGFTLIDLGSDNAALAFEKAASELHVPLKVIRDSATDGREKFESHLILVRPDQFVAWTGDSAEPATVLKRAVGESA
jgi:2-polyprenyl-6-methoxyphenol hydroxylase-like FAD-dependent oxidoreductase